MNPNVGFPVLELDDEMLSVLLTNLWARSGDITSAGVGVRVLSHDADWKLHEEDQILEASIPGPE